MKLRIFTEPQQGASYDTLLAVARRALAPGSPLVVVSIDDPTKPVSLAAGKHTIAVVKAGFLPQKESLVVQAGDTLDKPYKLAALGKAPAQGKCGKFLKRCK